MTAYRQESVTPSQETKLPASLTLISNDVLTISKTALHIGQTINSAADEQDVTVSAALSTLAEFLHNLSGCLKKFADILSHECVELCISNAEPITKSGIATILSVCKKTLADIDARSTVHSKIERVGTDIIFRLPKHLDDNSSLKQSTTSAMSEGSVQMMSEMLRLHIVLINMLSLMFESPFIDHVDMNIAPIAEKITQLSYHSNEDIRPFIAEIRGLARAAGGEVSSPGSSPGSPASSYFGSPLFAAKTNLTTSSSRTTLSNTSVPSVLDPPGLVIPAITTVNKPSRRPHLNLGGFHLPRRFDSFVTRSVPVSPNSEVPPKFHQSGQEHPSPFGPPSKTTNEFMSSRTYNAHNRTRSVEEVSIFPSHDFHKKPKGVDPTQNRMQPPKAPTVTGSKHRRTPSVIAQQQEFERYLFRNAAILCDVRGTCVEYTVPSRNDLINPNDFAIESVMKHCRICLVRHRKLKKNGDCTYQTSIWSFNEDFSVRLEQKLDESQEIIPYISYLQPTKASINHSTKLIYHSCILGNKPVKIATTSWMNYYFEDETGCAQFQNQLFDRTLLASFKTERTVRVHEGLANIVAHHEQICSAEHLRLWNEEETGGILANIHYSALFNKGYLKFYLNNKHTPVTVQAEGARSVRIKGLKIPADAGHRSQHRMHHSKAGVVGSMKTISAKVEFHAESDKSSFIEQVREAQKSMVEIGDVVCA